LPLLEKSWLRTKMPLVVNKNIKKILYTKWGIHWG
jgi:hypothetical protein